MIGRSPTRTDVVDPARFKDRLMIRLESIGCRFVSLPVHTFISQAIKVEIYADD